MKNRNDKETYTGNRIETFEISGTQNEERGSREFDTQWT